MKAIRPLAIIAVSLMLLSSCTKKVYHIHTHNKRTPPGHAKKMHGDKSAKKYAPGQRKKKH